jgi:hypothetical protein
MKQLLNEQHKRRQQKGKPLERVALAQQSGPSSTNESQTDISILAKRLKMKGKMKQRVNLKK